MKKMIKARLPKGFHIQIEESKNFLPFNVLVLVNNLGKRLYVKICEKEDLALGRVFEILTPSELKTTLNIEESYNGELYEEKGLVVQESLPESEEEIEQALNEGLKKLGKKGRFKSKGEGQPVNIIISKNEEDENSDRPLTTSEKRWLFKQSIKEIAEEALDETRLNKAIEEDLNVRSSDNEGEGCPLDYLPPSKRPAGSLKLKDTTGEDTNHSYDSYEAMIDDLTVRRNAGDKQAELILAELTHKTFKGRKQQPYVLDYEFRGEIDPVTKREKGLIELINERYRKQKKLEMERIKNES